MVTVGLVGRGIVGERIARRLGNVLGDIAVVDIDTRTARRVPGELDVVVLAHAGPHAPHAARFLDSGVGVVSVSDDLDDVQALVDLDDHARRAGVPLVVGAGMSPGLTELLARLLTSRLASCDEIHIAIHGTAGPACARQQHRALGRRSLGFHDGAWIRPPAGSGRELCYFPEPVGPYDCYRAEFATSMLVHASFPDVTRISARATANRRDRFTTWLPMLTPPHREGGVGAVRVEARGTDATGARVTMIAGVAELVATATAATTTAFVSHLVARRLPEGVVLAGDADLDTVDLLRVVAQAGVRLQDFTGVSSERRISANP
jgi:hypothetical protein